MHVVDRRALDENRLRVLAGETPRCGRRGRSSGRGLRLVEQHADWSERIVGGRREVTAAIHR